VVLSLSAGCQKSYFYNCHDQAEIDGSKRSAIAETSLGFMRAIFTGDADTVYSQFTDEAKASTTRDQLVATLQQFKAAGPFDGLKVEQVMTVTGWGDRSGSNGVAICSKGAAHRADAVTAAVKKIPEQAYTLVSATGAGHHETWIAALWLIPKNEKWEVHAFHVTIGTVLGRRADDYLAMAREERDRGHRLNAGLLYSDAASIATRGPFYHTGSEDVIQQEAQQITPPEEFRGQAPYRFAGPSGTYALKRLNTAAVNGKLYLVVSHETDPWKDGHEIEARNEALIRMFARRFPEYGEIFAGLVAEATVRDGNNGWRTIRENAEVFGSAKARK
ncbi:MAG TPA: hypothetical protein VIB39_13130, partial [Candidatus Angelobacter sp.]